MKLGTVFFFMFCAITFYIVGLIHGMNWGILNSAQYGIVQACKNQRFSFLICDKLENVKSDRLHRNSPS